MSPLSLQAGTARDWLVRAASALHWKTQPQAFPPQAFPTKESSIIAITQLSFDLTFHKEMDNTFSCFHAVRFTIRRCLAWQNMYGITGLGCLVWP